MSQIKFAFKSDTRKATVDVKTPFTDLKKQFMKLYKYDESCELSLTYVDSDNEVVTVSTDEELSEAIRSAKDKVLKVQVEVKEGSPSLSRPVSAAAATATATAIEEKKPVEDGPAARAAPPTATAAALLKIAQALQPAIQSVSIVDDNGVLVGEHEEEDEEDENDTEETGNANSNQPPVHAGVSCDMCGLSPIQGVRYKCKSCHNYDLCETCEGKNVHPSDHVLMKIRKPRDRQKEGRRFLRRLFGHRAPEFRVEFVDNVNKKDDLPVIPSNGVLDQSWTLKNSGSVAWPKGAYLSHHSGKLVFAPNQLNASGKFEVAAAQPGETIRIQVKLIPADGVQGRCVSKFHLMTPEGIKFSPRLWVAAIVKPAAPAAAPIVAPAAAPSAPVIAAPVAVSAPPAPAPVPVARLPSAPPAPEKKAQVAIPPDFQFTKELKEVEEIFPNADRNVTMVQLLNFKGNVQRVIDWLLANNAN